MLSKDNKFHSRTKHINLRYHFIREAIDEGKINVEYIPTAKNVADVFMKALAKPKFEVFVEMLGLGRIKEGRKNKESRLKSITITGYMQRSCDERKHVLMLRSVSHVNSVSVSVRIATLPQAYSCFTISSRVCPLRKFGKFPCHSGSSVTILNTIT